MRIPAPGLCTPRTGRPAPSTPPAPPTPPGAIPIPPVPVKPAPAPTTLHVAPPPESAPVVAPSRPPATAIAAKSSGSGKQEHANAESSAHTAGAASDTQAAPTKIDIHPPTSQRTTKAVSEAAGSDEQAPSAQKGTATSLQVPALSGKTRSTRPSSIFVLALTTTGKTNSRA